MTNIELLRLFISKSTMLDEMDLYKPSRFPNEASASFDSLFIVKSTDTQKFKVALSSNDEIREKI